ncbi:MAG: hypothetical protein IJJ22_05525 [Oscillospiraceae bacterium]|nr:hypothetical protein [Oscillospiraceae bacterium]
MKGTEKIIAHIRSDAQVQADAILAQAEQQCAAIRADFDRKAKELYGEKIRAGVRECEDKSESIGRIARMEARKGMLAVKQEMVAACFDRACEKITELPDDLYVDFLAKLACGSSVSGQEQIVLNARDRERVGAKTVEEANALLKMAGKKHGLTLADDCGDFAGGLVLRRGSIEDNCTVELLVDLCRGEMSSKVAGVLFG